MMLNIKIIARIFRENDIHQIIVKRILKLELLVLPFFGTPIEVLS